VADVACFVAMVTYKERMRAKELSVADWNRLQEQSKIQGSSPGSGRAGIQ
jgi:hypothetical protein